LTLVPSRHMSSGGKAGAAAFRNYQRFALDGTFWETKCDCTRSGNGTAGPVLLVGVLHVPEIAGPLLSVWAAVNNGWAVHFTCPTPGVV
jgi:hypothetical protein